MFAPEKESTRGKISAIAQPLTGMAKGRVPDSDGSLRSWAAGAEHMKPEAAQAAELRRRHRSKTQALHLFIEEELRALEALWYT